MVELPCELLHFFDLEGAMVGPPGCPQEGDGGRDELWSSAKSQSAQVKDEAKDPIHWGYKQFMELVPGDRVLWEGSVRFSEQDKDSFNDGGNGLLKAACVDDIDVDVIINVDDVWCLG